MDANNTFDSTVTQNVYDSVSSIYPILYNASFYKYTNTTLVIARRSNRRKANKPFFDNECESKYRSLKNLTTTLCTEPWNDKVYPKKELNKRIRRQYRQFRHKMITPIIVSNNGCSDDFWKTSKKLKQENFKKSSSKYV